MTAGLAKRMLTHVRLLTGLVASLAALTVAASSAAAPASAAEAPEWATTSYAMPTDLPPGGEGEVVVTAVNVGNATTDGSQITVKAALPSGLTATSIVGYDSYAAGPAIIFALIKYKPASVLMTCSTAPEPECTYSGEVPAGDQLEMHIKVSISASASESLTDRVSVDGGGAPAAASASYALHASSETAASGLVPDAAIAAFSSHHAGAHANITTGFILDSRATDEPVTDPKDVAFDLPPGAVGNTVGLPRCSAARAQQENCPADTIVGVATIVYRVLTLPAEVVVPVFNIAPSPGEPAAFLFSIGSIPVRLDTSVLSNGNYAVRVKASNLSQTEPVMGSYITIWGVPADHEGPGGIKLYVPNGSTTAVPSAGTPASSISRVPLLSNPTQCATALTAVAEADAWRAPGVISTAEAGMGQMSGCVEAPFASSFSFLPETLEAGAPAGYDFDLHVPQENNPDTPSTSDVKAVSLKLPAGVVVNPSAAWGLKACSATQFYGASHPSQEPASTAECSREAQVGTVWIKTPALEEALQGQVYLAEPECRPCTPKDAEDGRMVRLYVQAVSEGAGGIVVKLEGHGIIDQSTGQITTVFDEDPQLPFSEFKLQITGGPRSVLANPRRCGTLKTTGDLAPWSSLLAQGEAGAVGDSTPFYEFEINQNCFGPQFSPSFKAGMPNIQAGAHGQFTLAFGREDDSELLNGISVRMPEGLLGSLTGIPLCGEAQANAGTCSAESQIGTVEALTGPGANPFLVSGGHVYLTEGYGGSQFGLSIVVPAVAGPYTLGGLSGQGLPADSGTVVVRSQISIDPHTAQLTVTSGRLPSMLDGIPLQLKAVNVRIDRPGFMFNPTSCERKQVAGTLTAVEGMSASVSSPFQVTNCAALPFKPVLTAATKARHTRKGGAYLRVSVSSGEGQADIARAKVELPKKLPSRLSTLQQACTEAQFDANPAGCPAASNVGSVVVHTPVLPVPLTGPAYFVSRGAQWPELIMVLQGYGVTVELAGETHISKAGVTSTTLGAVPDVPFTSFTLTLPEGPHSALAGNGNLCKRQLVMPTKLTGQNGAQIDKSTKISVKGCASSRKRHKHKGKARGHAGKANRHAGKVKRHSGKAKKGEAKKHEAKK